MNETLHFCRILGTNINVTNMERTVRYFDRHLDELRGNYICVSNVHTTVTAYKDPAYRKVQNGGAMALPDGKPLSFVSRRRGYPEAKRVAGPDLMPQIFRLSEEKGYRNYFYGSSEETLAILEKKLREKYPKLTICGMYSPPYYKSVDDIPEEVDRADIERINAAKPDFIWIGLGAPKQELWMAKHKGQLTGVCLGVGAGFDFHAGTVKRAPRWMQETYLEWLYRITQDPKRLLKRYVSTNASFVVNTAREGGREKKRVRAERMNIAMIGHKRIPTREGGVEVVVAELSKRLAEMGDRVTAYNRGLSPFSRTKTEHIGKWFDNVRIVTIPTLQSSKFNAIVYSTLGSVRLLFGHHDVVHYHAEGPCITMWIPKLFGIPCVATIHGLDWQRAKWGNFASKMLKKGEERAAKQADAVIVLSRNMQQYFKETYGRDTIYLPNGIDRPEQREIREIRDWYGIDEKDSYILFLARLVPEKGIHYLIKAFRNVKTDKKLVIAGGDGSAPEYIRELHELAAGDDRIMFTGFVAGRRLEELYSNCLFFVLPSDVEGMAMGLLEAMSYGCCCVVSDIPENTEVTEDYAATFPKGNVEELTRVMQELVDHPEAVAEYRRTAAEHILRKYNWDDIAVRTRAVYMSVLKPERRKELEEGTTRADG